MMLTVLGLSGCSEQSRSGADRALTALSPTAAVVTPDAPLPPPEALSDVMYRLADPAVPGSDKLALVHDSEQADAGVFDRFAAALRDTGSLPVTFTAADLRWADPAAGGPTPPEPRVLATITVGTASPDSRGPGASSTEDTGDFSFPMAFQLGPAGWQLTRDSAESVLAYGDPH